MTSLKNLIDKLHETHELCVHEYVRLLSCFSEEDAQYAAQLAVRERKRHFGNKVYIRGLIEITNYCKNDCYYCGIRTSNKNCERYRLTQKEIMQCARAGHEIGFRTFVLQGGEDVYFTDAALVPIIKQLKREFLDSCVTLSLGERPAKSYRALKAAGADRYLLRHESATRAHYKRLHPSNMSYENRMRCLRDLRRIGFTTGAGFMVASPYQTPSNLAADLKFIEQFRPEMCGIGPYIPHPDTPFAQYPAGKEDLVLFCLSLIRLIKPDILLPATTALGTVDKTGRTRGILAGANVVMPNLSPEFARKKYNLYAGKPNTDTDARDQVEALREQMTRIGYEVVVDRGDPPAK